MTAEHPEDWTPARGAFTQEALEIALDGLEDEADEYDGEFAAGIRYAEQYIAEALQTDE